MNNPRSQEPSVYIENIQEFYSSILEYYDELFPLRDEAVQFFLRLQAELKAGFTGPTVPLCRFLGVGCATGTLENKLSGFGMDITGIDKNPDMVETANRRMKRASSTLRFFEMSALEMRRFLKQGSFHIISCIDNTLPFISDETLLRKFFHDVRELLSPGGKFVIQTDNFDFLRKNRVARLPDLSSVRVTLQRTYISGDDGLVTLDASLELGTGRKIILQKTTKLIPVTREKLETYAKEAGFTSSSFYADFELSPWTEESPNMVMILT